MNIKRLLGTSAATAVLVLAPQAAFADGYGGVTPPSDGGGGGGSVGGPVATGTGAGPTTSSGLPSTGSTALDTAICGAGLLLLIGGGATFVAARRRQGATA